MPRSCTPRSQFQKVITGQVCSVGGCSSRTGTGRAVKEPLIPTCNLPDFERGCVALTYKDISQDAAFEAILRSLPQNNRQFLNLTAILCLLEGSKFTTMKFVNAVGLFAMVCSYATAEGMRTAAIARSQLFGTSSNALNLVGRQSCGLGTDCNDGTCVRGVLAA